jgi:hypothetical protein
MDLADQFEEEFDFGPQLNRITRDIIGAAIEVHRALGPGHLESVYENALIIELSERGISFEAQFPVSIYTRTIWSAREKSIYLLAILSLSRSRQLKH